MSEVKLVKDPRGEGKKQTVVINGKPFWDWGPREHAIWQDETRQLIKRLDRIGAVCMAYMRARSI